MTEIINHHFIEDLSLLETRNKVLIETNENTVLEIEANDNVTFITFPIGNKFKIVNDRIIVVYS